MGEPVWWKHVGEFRWDLLEIPKARRDKDVFGDDRLLIFQSRLKSIVGMLEAMDEGWNHSNGLLFLEPRRITQEEVERDGLSPTGIHIVPSRIRVERVHAEWVEMPVPGRS